MACGKNASLSDTMMVRHDDAVVKQRREKLTAFGPHTVRDMPAARYGEYKNGDTFVTKGAQT